MSNLTERIRLGWESIKTTGKILGGGAAIALVIDGAGAFYKIQPESEKYAIALQKDKVEWADHALKSDFLWGDKGIRNFIELNNIDDVNAVYNSIQEKNNITHQDTRKGLELKVPTSYEKETPYFYGTRNILSRLQE